jgi:hypothetical protein
MEHSTLKSALAVANDYDRIEVYPGIYEVLLSTDSRNELTPLVPCTLVAMNAVPSWCSSASRGVSNLYIEDTIHAT